VQEESWNKYVSNIGNDVHGRQTMAYKVMERNNGFLTTKIMAGPKYC
jgi:hypothetical protein